MIPKETEVPGFQHQNYGALDGLRGVAILMVVAHHVIGIVPPVNLPVAWTQWILEQGWAGVDLFFVLSGFLITGVLLDSRGAKNYFQAFYARRFLRIFPLYYGTLILVLGAAHFLHPYPAQLPIAADRKLYWLYLVNWLCLWKGTWGANYIAHFWSLAVEEQFYLVWPLCIWAFGRQGLKKGILFMCVAALAIRTIWVTVTGPSQAIVMATVTRMDSLLIGALAALLFREPQPLKEARRYLPWVATAGLGTFAAAVVLYAYAPRRAMWQFTQTGGFTLLALGFGALILQVVTEQGSRTRQQVILNFGALRQIGRYSYGLYVFHVPVIGVYTLFVRPSMPRNWLVNVWAGTATCLAIFLVSLLIAAVSYECFEKHLLKLKRHFEPDFGEFRSDAQLAVTD